MTHLGNLLFSSHFYGDLNQIADDRVHFASNIAYFSELGSFHLDEGRLGEARQPTCDLSLADAGRADHENVFRGDLGTQRFGDLAAAPAIAQRDRDRAFGRFLADDVLVQLFDYFSRGHLRHGALQLLDRQIAVRVDADIRGDIERALDDIACGQVITLHESHSRSLCETSARTDGDQVMLRFDDIAIARNDVGAAQVRDAEQSLQPAQA